MKWGFLAGCLGALGALALTFSLTKAGGKPAYVMPIVFGGAVTVNAIAAYFSLHDERKSESVDVDRDVVGRDWAFALTAGYTPHGHAPATPATEGATPATEGVSAEAEGHAATREHENESTS